MLPAVPRPAARRDRARRGAGDPRPPARAGRRARRARRRRLPRGARPAGARRRRAATRCWPISRARCASASFDQPVIAAARDAVYAEMRTHVAALAEDPERARPRRAHRGARRRARGRSRRCSPRACATPRRPLRRVLLEATARRYYRVRTLEGVRRGDRRRAPAAARPLPSRGPPTPPRGGLRRARRRSARSRAPSPRTPRRCPAASWPSPISTRDAAGDGAVARRARRRRCARRSPASRCPPALHRIVVGGRAARARPRRCRP